MSKFHVLVHSLLLVTSPSLLAYPQCEQTILQQVYSQEKPFDEFNLTYDEILKLLQDIENERLEDLSEEKIDRMTHFIAFLAQKGMLPEDYAANVELERDIAALFENKGDFFDYYRDYDYAYASNFSYEGMAASSVLNSEDAKASFCKDNHQKKEEERHKKLLKKQRERREKDAKKVKKDAKKKNKLGNNNGHHDHNHHHKNAFAKIKDFIVKHKKAIIIGAAIVVAATIIIVTLAAAAPSASAIAAAAAAAAAPDSNRKSNTRDEQESSSSTSGPADIPPEMAAGVADLKSTIDNQVLIFKENIKHNQFFQPTNPSTGQQGLSWEDNGRALGSLFAHESYNNIQHQMPYYPEFSPYDFSISGWNQNTVTGHSEIDRKFSTDYAYLYSQRGQEIDFNTLSHQVRGEKALEYGYYSEAVQDFERAIELNPTNPIPYLERGIAHFNLGQYDRSIEDYKQFASQAQVEKSNSHSVSEFSVGFAKGLPKGVYESGEGLLLFLTDFVTDPIHTSVQIFDSVKMLVELVYKDELGIIAKALSPEIHQLITQWDILPSDKKGELAGYAVGKHGADIYAPGALAKVGSTCFKTAQKLAVISKNLQLARKTLLLETAAEIGNSAKIVEIVETGQRTIRVADELGFSTREMGQLKKAGRLEEVVNNSFDEILKNPTLGESYKLFEKAEAFLEPYGKKFMPESQVRDLIHQTGIITFPRPIGIPENFRIRLSDGGAGMLYVHPDHTHISIRVMPGKPHSSNLSQQKAYVVHMKNGKAIDKHGNIVDKKVPEAHIPIEDFIYRD